MAISSSVGNVVLLLDAVADGTGYKVFGISITSGTIQTYCDMSVSFYSGFLDDGTISTRGGFCNNLADLRSAVDVLKVVRGKLLGQPSVSIDGLSINKGQYISIINDTIADFNARIEQFLRGAQPVMEIVEVTQPTYDNDVEFVG